MDHETTATEHDGKNPLLELPRVLISRVINYNAYLESFPVTQKRLGLFF